MKNLFRILALLEGFSLLVLIFFAMPMKYLFASAIYVKTVGMAHGLLFIGYVFMVIYVWNEEKWKFSKMSKYILAAVIPFCTFMLFRKRVY